jgi:GTP-binding protein
VVFVGRSNVGKSSLLNSLCARRGLAKTSSTPGKTREINFFVINGGFYFVDLPGYGYARVPGKLQSAWGSMIEDYILESPDLKMVLLLLDIRHEPSRDDILMYEWLKENGVPAAYVTTKADKITRGSRRKHLKVISDALGIEISDIIEYSSHTGEGKPRLWEIISSQL